MKKTPLAPVGYCGILWGFIINKLLVNNELFEFEAPAGYHLTFFSIWSEMFYYRYICIYSV